MDADVHLVQEQALIIEALTARGPFGFFQRRRLARLRKDGTLERRIREDELRALNLALRHQLNAARREVVRLIEERDDQT